MPDVEPTPSRMKESYSHGKVLLSGEYLVTHGAVALAVPLRRGQYFQVTEGADEGLVWQSYCNDQLCMEARFSSSLGLLSSMDDERALLLAEILDKARRMSHKGDDFFNRKFVVTRIDFDPDWGFGNATTLIVNVSRWMGIDPFQLSAITKEASNYDIACVLSHHPILYCREGHQPHVQQVTFCPGFADELWFLFLGQGQMHSYRLGHDNDYVTPDVRLVSRVSLLSHHMVSCGDASTFRALMDEHERIVGEYIGETPVKQRFFSDFVGSVKSLGLWGSDFALVASDWEHARISDYFANKGLDVLFPYRELVLNVES